MSGVDVLGSVVIPAHNEAAVIERCLDALFDGMRAGELDVVVACNGCADGTAGVVRSTGNPVRLVELATPSKPAALRAAEELLDRYPRLYLDADVVLPGSSARLVLDRLRGGAVAARPPIRYEAGRSSWPVRRYYRARVRVPAVMSSLWGAGVYGLSRAGRARFGRYPDVVADDLFVDRQFAPDEIEIVRCPPVVVAAPRHTRDLVRILRRNYRGAVEQRGPAGTDRPAASAPPTPTPTTGGTLRDLARLAAAGPGAALDAGVYAGLAGYARLATRFGAGGRWERDESSRTG